MATTYLSTAEYQAYLTGDLKTEATTAQLEAALNRASSVADGYLRTGGYEVPVTSPTDDLKGRVADMASYHLAVVLRLLPEPADSSALYINYKDAVQWFRGVARGEVQLDVPLVTTGEEAGTPQFATNTRRKWEDGW